MMPLRLLATIEFDIKHDVCLPQVNLGILGIRIYFYLVCKSHYFLKEIIFNNHLLLVR